MRPEYWLYTIPLRLRSLFRWAQADQELDEELRDHIERKTEEYIANGTTPEEARRRASLDLEGVEQTKEKCRDARRVSWIQDLILDLRYGLRMLRKSPGFTAVAVLTLALGIGANTAVFSLLDAVLLKPLPVRNPRELVLFQWHGHKGPRYDEMSTFGDCDGGHATDYRWGCTFSSPLFDAFDAGAKSFDAMAAFAGPEEVQLSGNGPASMASAEIVTGDFFRTLGVRAAIGRTIERSDDTPTAPAVLVLSSGYWYRAFGGDTSAVGRRVRLNGVPVTIIGVADPSFTYLSPGKRQDIWITRWSFSLIGFNEGWSRVAVPGNCWLAVLARLKPAASRAQAQAEASLTFSNEMLHGSHPLMDVAADPGIALIPAEQGLTGTRASVTTQLYLLMFAVGTLLMIACANVAGLLLARSLSRQREIAVRFTLGAPRSRLVRQLLTESLLLSLLGGSIGILFAYWGVRVFAQLVSRSSASFPFPVTPDFRILTFTACISVVTGILFGLVPAFRSTGNDLTPDLKEIATRTGRSRTTGSWRFSTGNALVVGQVALAALVLTGAGLFVRTLHNLGAIDPGFDARNLLIFKLDPVIAGYKTNQIQALYHSLQAHFAAVPGVTSVAYSHFALLSGNSSAQDVSIQGHPDKAFVDLLPISPRFLDTMHIPLLLGRGLEPSDFDPASTSTPAIGSSPVESSQPGESSAAPSMPVLVNQAFVRTYCGKQNPLAIRMNEGGTSSAKTGISDGKAWSRAWQVVGVVADTKYARLREPDPPIVYLPLHGGGARFEIRTALPPDSLVPAFREVVAQHDPDLPLLDITTQTQTIEKQTSQERLIARLSSFFALLALLLACTGLYGLLFYDVTMRSREIGIRMTLGAQRADVIWRVIGQGLRSALLGLGVGIIAALGLTRLLSSLLFGLSPADPVTFISVSLILSSVATLASYIPAWRAMKVDPMVALRYE